MNHRVNVARTSYTARFFDKVSREGGIERRIEINLCGEEEGGNTYVCKKRTCGIECEIFCDEIKY